MPTPVLAIKADVDTYAGTRDNVPRLLHIFERFGIRGTFYFSMGPDNSGKSIRRIFTQKGYLRKALRTRGLSTRSLRTMLYGLILPPPPIASSFPEILQETEKKGHEVGIHSWDHVKWQDLLPWFPKPVTAMELGKAGSRFERIFGKRARATAAPGWIVTEDSLEVQDAMGLDYCSDCRGSYPFYPIIDGRRFRTLQIPATLPTLDEIYGEIGVSAEDINSYYLSLLRPGLNVLNINAEIEGGLQAELFIDLLERLTSAGVRFVTLAEAAEEYGPSAPYAILEMGELPGREGKVALQKS
jgi:peptidoglycan/xylan/chitin deacetylase (PgdA/CDA1 family)